LRVFVAAEFSNKDIIDNIVQFQKELIDSGADIKTVERENIHFTLKFIGEVPENVVSEIDSRLRKIKYEKIEVVLSGVGAFPSERYPRVVWAGVEDSTKLSSLAELVLGALADIGEEEKRGFTPHLTLCRVRSGRNKENLIRIIQENKKRVFGKVHIREIKLKSSILTQKGPIYSDIGAYPLV
jgi:2'-5' RNA ligase